MTPLEAVCLILALLVVGMVLIFVYVSFTDARIKIDYSHINRRNARKYGEEHAD